MYFLGRQIGLVGGKGSVSLSDSGVIYVTLHKASHIDDIISNVYCKHSCNAFFCSLVNTVTHQTPVCVRG